VQRDLPGSPAWGGALPLLISAVK